MPHFNIDAEITAARAHFEIDVPMDGKAVGRIGEMPTTLIEMTLCAQNLINADVLSKSDPYCVVQIKEPWHEQYVEVDRTERIKDNLNPEWVKKFRITYNFEIEQKMRFTVWDQDSHGDEFLGEYETTLAHLVSNLGRQIGVKLNHKNPRNEGVLIILTEEVTGCKQNIQLEFQAKQLERMCLLERNDPFLVIYRSNDEDGTCTLVTRTEVAHATQSPKWKPIKTTAHTLCNGDYNRSIKIECYDNRFTGDHKLIGACYTCLNILSKGPGESNTYALRNPKKHNRKEQSGTLELVNISISQEVSFLDYIKAGCQMRFVVALDFTASNKPHTDPSSLHFLNPDRPNSYEIALKSVGEIMQHYDTSRMYPAFGFGAKLPPSNEASHQFALNGNEENPYCSSIDEILQHYRNTLKKVELHGPTNFAPVIRNTITMAKEHQDGSQYFVLLIITDGIISDRKRTISSIIRASRYPISIIIVGVGDADFTSMDELDADNCRLSINGRTAARDIVQFVRLNQFVTGQSVQSQADLAKAVLAEIPDQMTGYMKSKGFKPINSDVQNGTV